MGQDLMDMGSPTDKPGDRILCIYPDGRITVFATNLYAVFGMQYIDGKVYVHHTPKFSVFDDDHGVGKNRKDLIASDNPHPWLPSFNDHIPSGFHQAMDGYFYISTGDKGIFGAVGTDGRRIEMRGGIYRMRPDGTGLEVYCTGTRNHLDIAMDDEDEFFTNDNTDDGGGWWARVTHMVDGGYYGYPYDFKPRRPYTLWMMTDWNNQTGAPTGALIYNEDALPQEYRGNMFACDWAGAWVMRLKLKRVGSTFEVSRIPANKATTYEANSFITRGDFDIRFRPVGICVTPDGMGFYITDWGVSGWKNGQIVGRLFKVTYTGKSLAAPKPGWYIPAATGKKFHATTGALVRALSHPSQSVRLEAQRQLAARHEAGEKKLAALLKNTKAPPYARWSAIWTMDAIDGGKINHQAILAALNDKDPTVQAQAARELGTRQAKDAVGPLTVMLESTNAMLRFRAATALGRIGSAQAIMPMRVALAQKDLFARYAAFKGLNRIGQADPATWTQIVDGLDSVNPAIREGTFFATRETYDVGLVKALRAFLAIPTIPTEPRTNVLNLLASLYLKTAPWNGDWWSTVPVNGPPPSKTERWEGSPVIAEAMRDAIKDPAPTMREIAFEWVRATHDTNQASLLRTMYEHETNVTMRASILRALPASNDANSRALITPILKDPNSPLPLLEAAIEMAQKIGGSDLTAELMTLAESQHNDQVVKEIYQGFGQNKVAQAAPLLGRSIVSTNYTLRLAAVGALTQIGGDVAIAQFLSGLDHSNADIRGQCITALGALRAKKAVPKLIQLSTGSSSNLVIQALADIKDIAALDVYLTGLASKNATIRTQCRNALTSLADAALPKIEAELAPTNRLSDETISGLRQIYLSNAAAKKGPLFKIKVKQTPLADYQSFALANSGDPKLGRKIFTDINGVNCVRCHRLNGEGAQIGPELTGIAMKQSRAEVIESVLYPSKQILDGYQQVFFYMKDSDDDCSGIIRSEDTDKVTIIDSLGKTNVLEKSKIKNRKISQISLMPEGLQASLSLQEFSDLIAYVDETPAGTAPSQQFTITPVKITRLGPAMGKNGPPAGKPADPLQWNELPLDPDDSADVPDPLVPRAPHNVPVRPPQKLLRHPAPPPQPGSPRIIQAQASSPAPPVKGPMLPAPRQQGDGQVPLPPLPPAPPGFPSPPSPKQ